MGPLGSSGKSWGLIRPELTKMYTYTWITDIESERVMSFHIVSDGPFSPDESEISTLSFFTPAQIEDLVKTRKVTPNFIYEWTLFQRWRRNGEFFSLDYPVFELCRCVRCERLRDYRESIRGKGRTVDSDYWNKPVPGFGDPAARILVVGLAPGAHGANRTGRPFTGDAAGDVLFEALYRCGLSNHSSGQYRGDGLTLKGVFITNAVKCAPPDNKPLPVEILQCMQLFEQEWMAMSQVQLVICLGKLAFDSVQKFFRNRSTAASKGRKIEFHHGVCWSPGNGMPKIVGLYHPSRRNINTGLITVESFCRDFQILSEDA